MEKRAVISDETTIPEESAQDSAEKRCCGHRGCGCSHNKEASASNLEGHPLTRLAERVKDGLSK